MQKLFIFSLLLLLTLSSSSSSFVSATTNITFNTLPASNYTSLLGLSTDYAGFKYSQMKGLVNFAKSMVVTATKHPLDLSFVRQQIRSYNSDAMIDYGKEYLTGPIVVAGLGILCAFIVPATLCIFCCCRTCCGLCGAKREQIQPTRKCRNILIVLFAICLCFMFTAVVLSFVGNNRFTESIETANTAANNGIANVEIYINNTVKEVDALYTNVPVYVNSALNLINTVSDQIGNYTVNTTTPQALAMFASLRNMSRDINDSLAYVQSANSKLNDIKTNATSIGSRLSTMASSLGDIFTDCSALSSPYCANLPSNTTLQQGFNYSSIPDLSPIAAAIQAIIDLNLESMIAAGEDAFNEIPDLIKNQTDNFKTTAQNEANNFLTEVHDQYTSFRDNAVSIVNDNLNVQDRQAQVDKYVDDIKPYDKYRSQGGAAVASFMLIIVVIGLVGLLLGICSNDANALPCDRSSTSNLAGDIIFYNIILLFLFLFWVFFFAAFGFLFSTVGHTVCDPINDGSIFSEIVDNPATYDDYKLPYCRFLNITTTGACPVTVQSVLNACANNDAIFDALRLDLKVNLTDLTDYNKYFNITEQFDVNFSIDNVTIFSNSTRAAFNDFLTTGLTNIDFGLLYSMTVSPALAFDATNYANTLTQFATDIGPTSPSLATRANQLAADLTQLNSELPVLIQNAKTNINSTLHSLQNSSNAATSEVNNALATADNTVNTILQTFADFLDDLVQSTIDDAIDLIDDFRNKAVHQLTSVMGGCQVISAIYDSVVGTVCVNSVYTIDTFMFSMGMFGVFSIFYIILAVRLAKYFRIMDSKYYVSYDGERSDYDIGMVTTTTSYSTSSQPQYMNDFNSAPPAPPGGMEEKPPAYMYN